MVFRLWGSACLSVASIGLALAVIFDPMQLLVLFALPVSFNGGRC